MLPSGKEVVIINKNGEPKNGSVQLPREKAPLKAKLRGYGVEGSQRANPAAKETSLP